MNNRLLTSLLTHESSERITELKLDAKMINGQDKNEQTALQLAAQYGRSNIVLLLLGEGAEIKSINKTIQHQHPLIGQLIAAFSEEKCDPAVTAGLYCYALNHHARELSERLIKHLPPVMQVEAKISTRQKNAYHFAEKKQKEMMVRVCNHKIENYAAIFEHAYAVKNYDAVRTILSGCNNHTALLEEILLTEQNDCVRFLMVAAALDPYEIALHLHKKKPQLLEKWIRFAWTREGLLQGLIEQSIVEDKLPAADILALISTVQQTKAENIHLLFERAVSKRYPIHFTVNTANQLPEQENKLVYRLGSRLHLTILRSGEDELGAITQFFPAGVLDIIFSYCDSNSQEQLKNSTFFKNRFALLNRPAESKKSAQTLHLNTQLRILNEFITVTEQELASKAWYNHPGQVLAQKKWGTLLVILLFIGWAVSLGFLGDAVVRRNSLEETLREQRCDHWYSKENCLDIAKNPSGKCMWIDPDPCLGIIEYRQTQLAIMLSTMIGSMFGGLPALWITVSFICSLRTQPLQRFNDLPLTSYKAGTREAAERMFSEFKGTLFNPFETSSMESKVIDVLGIARRERDTRQAQLTSLTEIRAEHLIDVDFEKVSAVDDTGSLNRPLLEKKM